MSEYYQLRRISIRDLTAFFAFLAGWVGSAAFAWPYLVVGWETGHFTRGVFNFLVVAFGTATLAGIAGLWLGSIAGAAWERRHRHRREAREAARAHVAADLPTDDVLAATARSAKKAAFAPPNVRYESGTMDGQAFLSLAQRVWPRAYDESRIAAALRETTNIGAFDGTRLVGAVRVLSDGYLFATIPEILVDPEYQRRGIGRELMRRALDATPAGAIFFGAQPESVGFFERIGAQLGPTGFVMRRRM